MRRQLIDLKYTYNEFFHMLHPHALMSVRLDEARVKRIFSMEEMICVS